MVIRLRGGGGPEPSASNAAPEMNLAPGGRIEQNIVQDPRRKPEAPHEAEGDSKGHTTAESTWGSVWDTSKTMTFNVQILNTASFARITGLRPPTTPVTAAEYAKRGLPFFSLDEAETDVSGGLHNLKSVAQIDKVVEPVVKPKIRSILRFRSSGGQRNSQHTASDSSSSTTSTAVATPTGTLLPQPKGSPRKLQKAPFPRSMESFAKNSAPPLNTPQHYADRPVLHHTPVNASVGAEFFNPAGPRMLFRSVEDLERDMRRMTTVSFG